MKNLFTIVFLFITCLVLYTLTVRGIYGNPSPNLVKDYLDQATKPFELSPERGRFLLTMSLAENKSFALSQELADAAYPDVGYYEGRYYIYFPPGVSLISLPFYIIGKNFNLSQVFSFFSISLFATLNLIFLFKIAREILKLPFWTSLLTPFIFGFATTAWSYAITLYQHHITTFFIVSSFYAVWRFQNRSSFSWLWACYVWFAYGAALFLDYPNAFFMFPVMLYLLIASIQTIKNKKGVRFSLRVSSFLTGIIFVILIFLHGYYNHVNFGDWKRVSGSLVGYKKIKEEKIATAEEKGKKILKDLEKKKVPVRFFKEEHLPTSFSILLFSRDRGIFLYSPIFILALLGILAARSNITREIATLLGIVGVNLFLYSSWGDPWGGWAYGPRYLIPSMAILSLFVAVWLSKTSHRILAKITILVLFLYSSAISLLGALTTNQVPPKVEADYLKMKYNFLLNLDYLFDEKSGSFFYNYIVQPKFGLNVVQYYLLILEIILFIFAFILFILPLFEKNGNKSRDLA